MKYIILKIPKFSTIFKKISFKRYNFLEFFKFTNLKALDLKKTFKYLIFLRINFKKLYSYFDIRKINFKKLYSYFDIRKINFNKLESFQQYSSKEIKKKDFSFSKFFILHLPLSIIFFIMLYLLIPTFYKYDKFLIEKEICKEKSIKCSIKGKVSYAFFPSPRIKIKNVTVIDVINKQQTIADIENISAKLSIKNLLTKDKHKIKKIDINKFILKLKIDNFKNYKNIFTNKSNLIPTSFNEGKIIFSDQKVDVAIINNTNIKLNLENKNKLIKLKGNFLSDDLYIDFKSEEIDQKWISDIIIKMANLNFLTKANIYPSDQEKNALVGNVLVKKNKHRFTGLVNYKEGNFKINKSEFKNFYLDGAVSGKIEFLPYFDFDLDLDLKSINFTKIYNYFLNLEEKKKKDFFRVHNKINGNLSLSSDKIYSNIGLVKSLESRLEFNNGNILIEQFLINLGKLGAADIIGSINNDKKFTHLKYETNIFIDNQKKFLSRFGIYNKKKIHPNLFISGHFDLSNVKNGFYEISDDEKLSNEDINFVEKEFNDFMLENGYESLFNLSKFKEFIKSTSGEIN